MKHRVNPVHTWERYLSEIWHGQPIYGGESYTTFSGCHFSKPVGKGTRQSKSKAENLAWIKSFTRQVTGQYGDFFFVGGYTSIWNQFRVFHPGYFAHTWRVCECKRPWMWSKPITLQLLTSVKQSLKFRFAVGFFGWFSCMFKVTGISFNSVTISYLLVCIGHPSPHLKTNKWRLTGGRQN